MKSTFLVGMILALWTSIAFAQCSWCVTASDNVCCDDNYGTAVTYTLPCNTSSIYIQYEVATNNRIEFIIADVSGGGYSELVHGNDNDGENCGCKRYLVYNSPVNAGHELSFRVKCRDCEDDCDNGSESVKFFTPSGNTCAANCGGS